MLITTLKCLRYIKMTSFSYFDAKVIGIKEIIKLAIVFNGKEVHISHRK